MSKSSARMINLQFTQYPEEEMKRRAREFATLMNTRRTVRDFSDREVPREIIEQCLKAAGSAPSGANRQPWYFSAITDAAIKSEIRIGAEKEELEFYQKRAPQAWLDALAPLGTDADKPFLEVAPWLIVIFGQKFVIDEAGVKQKNYYVPESVGIATGLLIAALHNAGLATLTHTPSPMKFLNKILNRPSTEKPMLILVVGYPASNSRVPDITRKSLDQIATFINPRQSRDSDL